MVPLRARAPKERPERAFGGKAPKNWENNVITLISSL
jgi:hypothetical protein